MKDATQLHIRPARPEEAGLFYTPHPEEDKRLGSDCYMLGKCWTGSYCRYFRESVLPLDPALEASLMSEGPRPDFKICPVCGGAVAPDRRQAYCSAACAKKAHRCQQREYMRKKRGASVDN